MTKSVHDGQDCNHCVDEDADCAFMGATSCRLSTAYAGTRNITKSGESTTAFFERTDCCLLGLPCRRWADQDADFASVNEGAACRNPDGEAGPWLDGRVQGRL